MRAEPEVHAALIALGTKDYWNINCQKLKLSLFWFSNSPAQQHSPPQSFCELQTFRYVSQALFKKHLIMPSDTEKNGFCWILLLGFFLTSIQDTIFLTFCHRLKQHPNSRQKNAFTIYEKLETQFLSHIPLMISWFLLHIPCWYLSWSLCSSEKMWGPPVLQWHRNGGT